MNAIQAFNNGHFENPGANGLNYGFQNFITSGGIPQTYQPEIEDNK